MEFSKFSIHVDEGKQQLSIKDNKTVNNSGLQGRRSLSFTVVG